MAKSTAPWGETGSVVKRVGTVICITVLVVALAGAVFSGSWLSAGIRILIGAVATISLLLVVLTAKVDPPHSDLGKPPVVPPDDHELAQAYYNAARTYQKRFLGLFAKMLVDIPTYLERISETATVEEELPQLQVSTIQTFRLGAVRGAPKAEQTRVSAALIPLVFVQKGRLLDGFSVSDADGREIPTLSYNQARGLLSYAIRWVIENVPAERKDAAESDSDKTIKEVVRQLTEAICGPGPLQKQEEGVQNGINTRLDSIGQLRVSEKWKKRIRAFCEILVDYYVIVAELPPPEGAHIQISYRQRIPVESSSLRIANRWRSRFGLRFAIIDIPLHFFALRAEAYHLQMNAAPMQYVYDHHLEWLTSESRVTQADLRFGRFEPYVRLHYNTAEPAMHLYIRRQPYIRPEPDNPVTAEVEAPESGVARKLKAWPDRLKSVVEFREIPPGTLGAAAAISFMTSIIIGFFALTQIGEAQSVKTVITVASDIPALLIALPGIASLIVGAWLDLSHLRRASLTTYWGLCASMILSFGSALYFLLDAYKTVPGRINLSLTRTVIVHTDITWLVFSGLSISCTLFLWRDVIASSRYYFQSVKGRITRRHLDETQIVDIR